MKNQFVNLERKILPGGSERIGHPERGGHHDDIAVVVSGCLVALAAPLTGAESTIEFYRRQVEEPNRLNTDFDDFRASGPEFGFSFSGNQPEPTVSIELPPIIAAENSHINIEGKSYSPRRRENRAFIEVPRTHAIQLFREMPAWREYNISLVADLKERP
jgi:hypothetical protein